MGCSIAFEWHTFLQFSPTGGQDRGWVSSYLKSNKLSMLSLLLLLHSSWHLPFNIHYRNVAVFVSCDVVCSLSARDLPVAAILSHGTGAPVVVRSVAALWRGMTEINKQPYSCIRCWQGGSAADVQVIFARGQDQGALDFSQWLTSACVTWIAPCVDSLNPIRRIILTCHVQNERSYNATGMMHNLMPIVSCDHLIVWLRLSIIVCNQYFKELLIHNLLVKLIYWT